MNEDGVWRTINGARVFIKNGETPMDAFIRQQSKSKSEKQKKQKEREKIVKKINDLENTELAGGRYSFKLKLKDASDEVLKNVYYALDDDYIRPYEGKYAPDITKKTYNKLREISKNISDYLGW